MNVELSTREHSSRASIRGTIDGDADFVQIAQLLSNDCVLDLAGVTMITSAGVLRWLRFVKSIPEGVILKLEGCPVSFINQVSMIAGFLGSTVVESLYVPYLCPQCGEARNVLSRAAEVSPGHVPAITCSRCGTEMEADVIEEQFFSFLA